MNRLVCARLLVLVIFAFSSFALLTACPPAGAEGGNWPPVGQLAGGLPHHVAVQGNYAYVAAMGGLTTIDISSPSHPAQVGHCDTPDYAEGVTVAGGYAYVADYTAGLRVIDVSNPASPAEVGHCDTPCPAWDVGVVGGYAYVADYGAGLRVIDVSNPASPVEVGHYDTPGDAMSVALAGGYAYVADGPAGLRVIDVSDPVSPVEVGHCDTPYSALNVAVAGGCAYVADGYAGLRVIDVSDPARPVEVGNYAPCGALDVAVAGGYAYVADGYAGLRVIDVSNPASPVDVGYYDTPGTAYAVAAADGYAYLAAWPWGLVVFAQPVPGTISGQVRVKGTTTDIAGATVETRIGDALKWSATTNAQGIYTIRDLLPGEYVVTASKQGYVSQTKADIVVASEQTTYINFNLDVSGRLTGQVREKGTTTNVEGATVVARSGGQERARTTTGTNGIYVMESDLPTGTYLVAVSKPGWVAQTKMNISVAAGATSYVNFFAFERVPAMMGQVRQAGTSTNLAGAAVAAYDGATLKATATTDANGIYQIGGLATGTYTVIASKTGYVKQTKPGIAVTAGAITYVNFALAVSGKLKGQVTNKVGGAPIIGATISARTGGVVRATGTTVGPWGIYEIPSDLPAGTYTMLCTKAGYQDFGRIGIVVTSGATTYVNFFLQPQ